MNNNMGIKVRIDFHPNSHHAQRGVLKAVLRNVDEVHYNYRVSEIGGYDKFSALPDTSTLKEIMIAFESGIHSTGITIPMSEILEFDTHPETEIAENF